MRWDALFADLEAEVETDLLAERRAEVADRTRAELGRLRLLDRLGPLVSSAGGGLRVAIAGHDQVRGNLAALGSDWMLITQAEGAAAEILVPFGAVQWIQGLTYAASEPGWEGVVGARATVRLALRRLVRDRAQVIVGLVGGAIFSGKLSRVGLDHVELKVSGASEPESRPSSLTIPLQALAFVKRG